ncbi:non-specific serine,threonine protein kinase [Sarracenia purpurea var. burkii]
MAPEAKNPTYGDEGSDEEKIEEDNSGNEDENSPAEVREDMGNSSSQVNGAKEHSGNGRRGDSEVGIVHRVFPKANFSNACVQVQSKMGCILQSGTDLKVLDLGLQDEVEEVRTEAVISMPIIVLWYGLAILTHMFKRL